MHLASNSKIPNAASTTAVTTQNPVDGTRESKFTRTLELPVPMLDAKVFLKLLQLDLKAHPPGAPILKVQLSAKPAQPRATQGGLFLPPTPEPEKLELTMARIAGMVGEDKVGALQLLDSHRPEAFRMKRFVPTEPKGQKEKSDSSAIQAPITALRMFRPPVRAVVTLHEGKPAYVVCPKRKEIHGEISWMAGPWRSSGDWWEQDGWARDEWDIAIKQALGRRSSVVGKRVVGRSSLVVGEKPAINHPPSDGSGTSIVVDSLCLYRLVHDLLSGHWFVEGTYD